MIRPTIETQPSWRVRLEGGTNVFDVAFHGELCCSHPSCMAMRKWQVLPWTVFRDAITRTVARAYWSVFCCYPECGVWSPKPIGTPKRLCAIETMSAPMFAWRIFSQTKDNKVTAILTNAPVRVPLAIIGVKSLTLSRQYLGIGKMAPNTRGFHYLYHQQWPLMSNSSARVLITSIVCGRQWLAQKENRSFCDLSAS